MSFKLAENIAAAAQLERAERFFKVKLNGYEDATCAASHTLGPSVLAAVGKHPLPLLLDTMFNAGFIVGNLFAQDKKEEALAWLKKQA